MFDFLRVAVMSALWVLSSTLMVAWTIDPDRVVLGGWALFVALVACVFTGWSLLSLERHRIETIAEYALDGAVERMKMHSV